MFPVIRPKTAIRTALSALAVWGATFSSLHASEIEASPSDKGLQEIVDTAQDGDRILLGPGDYSGPIILHRPVMLEGGDDVRIVGNGTGNVITIDGPDVMLRGVTVTGSGLDLSTQDSGVFVTPNGDGAVIEDSVISDNLIGIYLSGPENATVRNNIIVGRQDLRVNERGNGVQLWNTPGSVVVGNAISQGRDGIFVTTSKQNRFIGNEFRNVRFAVHYMYTHGSEIRDNRSFDNTVGYALMFSDGLKVTNNLSRGDRDHGILLNYANKSEFSGNVVDRGGEKCVFIYNSNKNDFRGNRFEGCGIGVQFTAGSERNVIVGNAFSGNRTQVKYVGTRWLEWSENGRGNYWSDNAAFDLDGDGLGDRAYRPNDMLDQVVWAHPSAKLLLNAPAIQILKWAQSRFPALHPGGVIDSHPLMAPPVIARFEGDGYHAD